MLAPGESVGKAARSPSHQRRASVVSPTVLPSCSRGRGSLCRFGDCSQAPLGRRVVANREDEARAGAEANEVSSRAGRGGTEAGRTPGALY